MLSLPACAWGAEGASTEYVGGFTGFAAGYVPTDPGTYLANYLYYYNGSTAAVAVNGKVALNVSPSVYIEIPQLTYITKLTLFGGNYGFGIAVPVGYVNVDVGINPVGIDRSASTFGLGDSILVPAVIGWHSGNWHTNLALSVFAPTGQYDQNQRSISPSTSGRLTARTAQACSPRQALICPAVSVTRSISRIPPRTTRAGMSYISTWRWDRT
jgi:hypothetical protein